MTLQNHPAADLFPMMGAEELDRLTKSIREQGLIEPIITHEDMILDGRNRAKACGLAGVEPRYAKWDGAGGSPTMFAVSKNLSRRHLTLGQQAAVAVEMLPLLAEEARKRQATSAAGVYGGKPLSVTFRKAVEEDKTPVASTVEPETGRASELAAKAVGVSASSVERAAAVKENDPEAFNRIKSGESKVNTEFRRVVKGEDVTKKPTPAPTGKRAEIVQNAHFNRMSETIGMISGHCAALGRVNVMYAAQAGSQNDLTQWLRYIEESIAQLRNAKKEMERVKSEYASKRSNAEHTGEGSQDTPDRPEGAESDQTEAYREDV